MRRKLIFCRRRVPGRFPNQDCRARRGCLARLFRGFQAEAGFSSSLGSTSGSASRLQMVDVAACGYAERGHQGSNEDGQAISAKIPRGMLARLRSVVGLSMYSHSLTLHCYTLLPLLVSSLEELFDHLQYVSRHKSHAARNGPRFRGCWRHYCRGN